MRESNQALRQVIRIGDRKKIDTAATGTLFLAYMSEKERERVATAVKLLSLIHIWFFLLVGRHLYLRYREKICRKSIS